MFSVPVRVVFVCAAFSIALFCISGTASSQALTTWSGVYSAEQAADGEAIYLDRCATCHQPDLSGAEDAPQLAGALFGTKWNERTLDELFELMRKTMPKDAPGGLTTAEYAQLLAHVLQRNGFPEGKSPLSDHSDALKAIQFLTSPGK
jgi:mono/diheme cytochrome c family protein